MNKKDIHIEALKRFKTSVEGEKENRRLAEEDYLFASGDEQWPDEVRRERELDGRPCLTINRLPQFVRQVMGDARQNKPAIKVRPVEDSDKQIAEIYEGLIRSIERGSNAPQAYMTALEHALTGGFGHWRIKTDWCDNQTFDKQIEVEPIRNPFAVFWDAAAKRYDRSDANFCFVTEWMGKEEYERRFPGQKDDDWETELELSEYTGWIDNNQRVRVSEYWVKERVEKTLYQYADGSTSFEEIPGYVRKRKLFDTEISQYLLSGEKVLEGPNKWAGKYIPIVSCWGIEEFVGGRHRYISLIRHAKDPQRMYNYWQSTLTEKIALAPRAPWLATPEQIAGLERFWNNANNSNIPYLPYNPDAQAPPPQRNTPAMVNAAELQQAAQSIDDLKATTGIYDASLGARGNETSGVAIRQREMQGDTSTYAWIDNLSRSIEYTGRILLDLIPKIYDTTRVIDILYEDETTQSITLNEPEMQDIYLGLVRYKNDLSVGKYDVVVQTGPSYNTRRQEAADTMMAFAQAVPGAAGVIGDLIAKNMDWPGADEIAERLKKVLPPELQDESEDLSPEEMEARQQQAQQQQAMQQEAYELEKAEKTAGIQKTMAEIRATMAKAAKDAAEAEAQTIENDSVESGLAQLLEANG